MSRHDSAPELDGSQVSAYPGPDLRWDQLSPEWVIVAPGRGHRPHVTQSAADRRSGAERVADCPLCPGNEHETPPAVLTLTEPASREPWTVRVVPNLYPAVSTGKGSSSSAGFPFRSRRATGVHEVVVETAAHNRELPDRELSSVLLLLDAMQQRLTAFAQRPATRHVVVFKNKGLDAGTSLEHPHSQIVALDFLPEAVRRRVQIARRFHNQSGDCLLCSLVAEERRAGARIVFEGDGFVAFAPYASGSAGETLLVPQAHAASWATASPGDSEQLAHGLIALLRRLRDAFDDPAYNLVLQTAPKRWRQHPALHWYWHLSPRLTRPAGFEWGTGLRINPMPPEEAALLLRDA